jgi:hypothetical protein
MSGGTETTTDDPVVNFARRIVDDAGGLRGVVNHTLQTIGVGLLGGAIGMAILGRRLATVACPGIVVNGQPACVTTVAQTTTGYTEVAAYAGAGLLLASAVFSMVIERRNHE